MSLGVKRNDSTGGRSNYHTSTRKQLWQRCDATHRNGIGQFFMCVVSTGTGVTLRLVPFTPSTLYMDVTCIRELVPFLEHEFGESLPLLKINMCHETMALVLSHTSRNAVAVTPLSHALGVSLSYSRPTSHHAGRSGCRSQQRQYGGWVHRIGYAKYESALYMPGFCISNPS